MTEVLQKFSTGSMSAMLWIILGSWLIWPILCGVLGARRNMAAEGAMHGLFWGPIGLLVVLMKKPRHACPTCGKRTLTVPAELLPGTPPPSAITLGAVALDPSQAGPPPTRIAEERRSPQSTKGERDAVAETPTEVASQKELEALRNWVNAG